MTQVLEVIDRLDLYKPTLGAHEAKVELERERHPDLPPRALIGIITKQSPRWDGAWLKSAIEDGLRTK